MDTKELCLGALSIQEGSGYDIKKLFEAAFSHFQGAGFGTIYPALAKLAGDGLVTVREEAGAKGPDRKVYTLTEAGAVHFAATLAQMPPEHRLRSDFLVLMFFAHLLEPARLAQVLDEFDANFSAKLEYLRSVEPCDCHTVGMRFTVAYGLAVTQAMLDFVRSERGRLQADHLKERE